MKKCKECGAELKKGTEFCEQCGTKQNVSDKELLVSCKRNLNKDIWIIAGTGVLVLLLIILFSFLIRMSVGNVQKMEVGVDLEEPYMEPVKTVKEAIQMYDNQKAESVWLPILVDKEYIKYNLNKDRWICEEFNIVSANLINTSEFTEEEKAQLYENINFSENEEIKTYLEEITDIAIVTADMFGISKKGSSDSYYESTHDELDTFIWYIGKWHDQWYIIKSDVVSKEIA